MFDLNPLFEFSRNNCGAICTFLVPANLLGTGYILWLWWRQKVQWRGTAVGIASIFPVILALHVSTWLVIGVITPITFILFGLASTCLLLNLATLVLRLTKEPEATTNNRRTSIANL